MEQKHSEPLHTTEVVMRRLLNRDAEMCVLQQRLGLLLGVPDKNKLALTGLENAEIPNDSSTGVGKDMAATTGSAGSLRSVVSRDSLGARLAQVYPSQQQASLRDESRRHSRLDNNSTCNSLLYGIWSVDAG